MEIIEEVDRRRQTIKLKHPETGYEELRDLLEGRMSFGSVHEDKYLNDTEKGKVQARITTVEGYDNFTKEKMKMHLEIDKETGEMDLQIKTMLITDYPEKYRHQKTVWYYAYRSLFDKFLYGSVREEFKPAVEDRVEELLDRLREALEAQ